MDDIPRTKLYRFLEILPGAVSWTIIIVPFIAAIWFPRGVSIFIACYIILWFLRALKSNIFLAHSFYKSKKMVRQNWIHTLSFFSNTPPAAHTNSEREIIEQIAYLKKRGLFKTWTNIYHVVIIPTFKEEKEILESSLEALSKVEFPLERIFVVLATEERDKLRAEENAAHLSLKFKKTFGEFKNIMHPANLPGEIKGKGANITYAARNIAEILKAECIDFSDVLVTTLDADNRPHPTYFSNLTYHYLIEPERNKRTYQPLNFFYNNIWDVPFTNRLIALANTFWYLAESGEPHHLFNASAYAQSLDMLQAMNFWSRQTIVEDLHQFWRAYFHFHGNHEVVPLFVPVYQDALENRTYFTSLLGQYTQLRRWAWGSSEIPYIIMKIRKMWRVLPLLHTFVKFIYLWFLHIMWATAPIIILLNKSIPNIINRKFSHSVFAYNLGSILNIVFTIMIIGILISLWISFLSLPKPKGRRSAWYFLSLVFQLLLVPFVTIFYGALPALDAQTRLMVNKPLGFVVTEKVRKIN